MLAEIDASSRLDGTQMLYRLGYADANELRPYGQSRWSQVPAQLLRQRVREALEVGHTVLGPEESATIARTEGRVPDTLRLSLEEFSQYFESPTSSVGLVRVSATLIREQSRRRPRVGATDLHGAAALRRAPTRPAGSRRWLRPAMRWRPIWWPGWTRPAETHRGHGRMQRIGLISDTHGLLRPEALAFLQGCDHIVHGGDIGIAAHPR